MKKTDSLENISNQFEVIIGEDKASQRIDKVLSSHPMIASRTQAAYLIDEGLVLLKDKPVKASFKTNIGDKFLILIPQTSQKESLEPFDFALDIIYEDSDLLVVNKPAGLVVHPAHGHYKETLVNALIHHTKDLSMGFSENRPGIVHRLDKETSGLLVVAKNNFTHEHLAQQFQQRTIQRKYWAVVYGEFKESEGRIETLIGRHPGDRKKFSSKVTHGKTAITNFKKLKYSVKGFTLLEVRLETGRTHQIRVHLSDKGFPVAGDNLYGASRRTQNISAKKLKEIVTNIGRIALHAKELGFVHPKTREELFFTSQMPSDLMPLIKECDFE
jgi:23S rRNA pseudouridine1911/1915/1917 synthase